MRLHVENATLTGEVLDLRERRVDADAVVAALYDQPSPYELACASPAPVHERVGVVRADMTVQRHSALALAARSRGLSAPQDERIERLREELADVEVPGPPAAPEAAPKEEVTRLRERVSELRGRLRALEGAEHDASQTRAKLREAAGRLSELETRRAARAQAGEQLRAVRDARERRFRLEDRLANAERAARAHLAERLRPAVTEALAELEADCTNPATAPADALAVGILRVAAVSAPVVLCVDRLGSPAAAAEWLDAPLIRV